MFGDFESSAPRLYILNQFKRGIVMKKERKFIGLIKPHRNAHPLRRLCISMKSIICHRREVSCGNLPLQHQNHQAQRGPECRRSSRLSQRRKALERVRRYNSRLHEKRWHRPFENSFTRPRTHGISEPLYALEQR